MTLELAFIFIAYCGVLLLAFKVAAYYLRNEKQPEPSELKKGQKIIAMYKDETRAARVTRNHSDIKVIYAVTLGVKKEHIRVEYSEVLEVVK